MALAVVCDPRERSRSNYQYPDVVRLELDQEDRSSYERAADFLNFNGNDLVCLQHEYGIFGGVAGSHILTLLRRLKMPLVTTLHTVLREPDRNQRAFWKRLPRLSDRLIVMSEHAASLLRASLPCAEGKNRHHSPWRPGSSLHGSQLFQRPLWHRG